MEDEIYGLLLGVERSDDQMILKIDLTGETVDLDLPQPMLTLHLFGCVQADLAYNQLMANIGLDVIILSQAQAEGTRVAFFFDHHDPDADSPNLEMVCADLRTDRGEYTATDLAAKLKWQNQLWQRRARADEEEIRHLRATLASVDRELRKELDRADRKIDFFTGKDKVERYLGERKGYERILAVLEYQERRP